MSEKDLRRRILVNRRTKPPPPNRRLAQPPPPSTSTRRRIRGRSIRPTKPVKILQRCKSEPTLLTIDFYVGVGDDHRDLTPPDAALYRPLTCTDIFSPPELLALSPQKFEGYNKDAKVVVNVTVDGSPGPVRAMVKLGSSVDETIRLVMERYSEEGRTPCLDRDCSSGFELHHSYFSLQSLDKSDMIGDVGSRSFYLRKSSSSKDDIVMVKPDNPTPPHIFLQAFISRKINTIIRKTRKVWKILGCLN